jgi:hypothetical protein
MTTQFLTPRDVDALMSFLLQAGLVGGRDALDVRAAGCALLSLVDRIVAVAVEDVKIAAVKAGCDLLENQHSRMFESLRRQMIWPQ